MAKKIDPAKVATNAASGASFAGVPGAVVGGLFGIGESIFQNKAQQDADRQQQRYARENAKYQAARQDYLQRMEMEYNSPQNQLAMLRKAGLNPNLIYDQLQDFTTSAPSAPMPANNPGSPRKMEFSASAMAGAQLGLQSIQTDATVDLARSNARKANADATKQEIDNEYESLKVNTEINKMISDIDKILADTNLTNEQRDLLVKQKDALVKKATAEAEKTSEEVDLVKNQSANVSKDTELKGTQISNVKADTNLKQSQTKYTNSLKDLIDSKKTYQDLINSIQVLENDLRENEIEVEQKAVSANFHMWEAVKDFCKENPELEGKEAAVFEAMMTYYERAGIYKASNDYDTYANELRTPSFWLDLLKTVLNFSRGSLDDVMGSTSKKKQ